MRKYHIADLLTLLRAVLGVVIFGFTFLIREPATGIILILFSLGELTDALDGEFARRYPYPHDGKKRWWREYKEDYDIYQNELNDIYADLLLGIATLVYIAKWVSPFFGGFYLGATIFVGLYVFFSTNSKEFECGFPYQLFDYVENLKESLILRRRRWYAVGLAIVILTLLLASGLPGWIKALLILIGILVGAYIYELKKPTRLKEDKTRL